MGDDACSETNWTEEAHWAERRFWNMRSMPGSLAPRQEKQAARDRKRYPYFQSDALAPLMTMLRFMVDACGIPYAHAEAHAVKFYVRQEKHQLAETTLYNDRYVSPPEDADPNGIARILVKRGGTVEALIFARIANQARKGTSGAAFWNDVVRELRTARFSEPGSIKRIVELDEADREKESRRRIREWRAQEKARKAAARSLQAPKSDE